MCVISAQNAACVVLFTAAPYRFCCLVGQSTTRWDAPQMREACSLFGESPAGELRSAYRVFLHETHND